MNTVLWWQIDLLENQAFENIVVLSIVLEEVKNKNMAVYNRIRALCSNSTKKFYVFSNEYHRYAFLWPFLNDSLLVCSLGRLCYRIVIKERKNKIKNATRLINFFVAHPTSNSISSPKQV